jgi:hypothetical protein
MAGARRRGHANLRIRHKGSEIHSDKKSVGLPFKLMRIRTLAKLDYQKLEKKYFEK